MGTSGSVSPDKPSTATIISNWIPGEDPAAGVFEPSICICRNYSAGPEVEECAGVGASLSRLEFRRKSSRRIERRLRRELAASLRCVLAG
jgi:hypothetical protein